MLQWADTFNRYGGPSTAMMLDGLYAGFDTSGGTSTLEDDPDPSVVPTRKVFRTPSVSGFGAATSGVRRALPTPRTTIGVATRFWASQLPFGVSRAMIISFRDVSNTTLFCLRLLSTGAIELRNQDGTGGTLYGATTGPVIPAHAWTHIEIKGKSDAAAGTIEVRINGQSVLNLAALNTGGASIAQIFIGAYNIAAAVPQDFYYWKDFCLWDTTGTYNVNFLGSVSVLDIDPVSDVALTWTPSTGANGWSILDNNPPLDDAAYISAAAALSNTFGLGDLPADTTSVRGLVLLNRSRKIDGGDGNVQMGIISGASTGLGTDRPITTAYTSWADIMEVDPATALPFTPSGFNASNFKLARTL
jgi:hypothetical protein